MKKITVILIIGATILLSFSCSSNMKYSKNETGVELWAQNCTRCHNSRDLNSFNDQQWEVSLAHMRTVGNIPGDQARKILKFLKDSNIPEGVSVKSTKSASRPQKGDASKGKATFVRNCSSCHGVKGDGNGLAARALTPRPRDLTDPKYMSGLSDNYLFDVIKEGGISKGKSPLMPGFSASISDQEISDIVSFIKVISK